MQKYFSLCETVNSKGMIIRGYGWCKDAKDAIMKAESRVQKGKETILRVWIAFMDAVEPVYTLVWGKPVVAVRDAKLGSTSEMPLDRVTIGMHKNYCKQTKTKGKDQKSSKLKVKIKQRATPTYQPLYIVEDSSAFCNRKKSNEQS